MDMVQADNIHAIPVGFSENTTSSLKMVVNFINGHSHDISVMVDVFL